MRKQRGFTLIDVLAVLGMLAVGGVFIGVIVHFIAKFW